MSHRLQAEAKLIAHYLGAVPVDENLLLRYYKAVEMLSVPISPSEEKIMQRLISMPFLLSLVDGGLALLKPDSIIRKRILIMSALMETDRNYMEYFLLQQDISLPLIRFICRGVAAGVKGILGGIIVILLRWR